MVAGTAGDMRRLLQRVTVEYRHLRAGPTTRCSGWCRWTTPPGTSTGPRGTSSACRLDFPATPLLRAGRLLGGAHLLRRQQSRGRLPLAGRRDGAGAERRRAAEPARLPLPAMRSRAAGLRRRTAGPRDSTGQPRRAATSTAGASPVARRCAEPAVPPPAAGAEPRRLQSRTPTPTGARPRRDAPLRAGAARAAGADGLPRADRRRRPRGRRAEDAAPEGAPARAHAW